MEGWGLAALKIMTLAVMAAGLISVLFIPGLVIIWFAALIYGMITGFNLTSGILFGAITILMLVGTLLDNVVLGAAARRKGVSWKGIILSFIVGLVGSIFLTPIGGLAAALLSLFAVEWIRMRKWRLALNAVGHMLAGYGWSILFALSAGILMILLWGAWVLWT